MAQQDIRQLIAKYLDGSISKDEYRALLRHFQLPEHAEEADRLLYQAIANERGEAPVSEEELEEVMDSAYQQVQRRIAKRQRKVWRLLPYAAAVLIMALAGAWLFFLGDISQQTSANRLAAADVPPGGNRATLTLADGRTIDLSEAQTGIIVGDEHITYGDRTSVVMLSAAEASPAPQPLVLTTPKGGTYSVTLPDGTKVWLNAASTLKYPSHFTGNERTVELEGEAYFEVRQKTADISQQTGESLTSSVSGPVSRRVPFWVVSKGQRVEVLGTEFNIAAYPDEPVTKTTLVTGSVRLRAGAAGASVSLVPGEQGLLTDGAIEINEVATEQYTAWKNGLFDFTGKTLRQLMPELARWYDIEVAYEGTIRPITYVGRIYRNNNLSEVLEILKTAKVSYRLEGRKLIVTGN